jgi:hypothetical protein
MSNKQKWGNICYVALATFAILPSAAKARVVDGQVFVVTRGAEAIKLPLVQILAIPVQDMENHLTEVEARIKADRARADSSAAAASSALSKAEHGVSGGFGRWMMTLQKTQRKDPTGQAWSDPGTESHRFNSMRGRIPSLEGRLEEVRTKQSRLHSAAPFFEGLPTPEVSAKTDADGRFKLSIPDQGEFALVAASSRAVGDRVEKYYWVVRLKPEDSTVTLSNDNLTSSGSTDSLLKTDR